MPFKLLAFTLLALINFSYSSQIMAAPTPPLDVIELLGEIDDDSMLAAALAEIENKPSKNQKKDSTKTSSKQNTESATPAGGNNK